MKELLKQALAEFKANHDGDTKVDMAKVDELIKMDEKGYLMDPYLAIAERELEGQLDWMEDDEDYEKIVETIRADKDEVVGLIYDEIQSDDYIWDNLLGDVRKVIDEYAGDDCDDD